MMELLPERGREKKKGNRLNNLPQVKQILSCQEAKYDRAISLKAAAESAPTYLTHIAPADNLFFYSAVPLYRGSYIIRVLLFY